ncbi:hypothetical protein [Microbacterium sp.]|uniref:hypothetical protein n=1 Tax=Microbacterium sp. TaxID=51671 RepID=UPI003C795969
MVHEMTEAREARGERLKERIYLAFVALAVVLAVGSHSESPAAALFTLIVTALGTLLAVLVADVISHFVIAERGMTGAELRKALFTSFGALTAVIVPVLAFLIALAGWWSMDTAVFVAATGLIVALVVIGYTAIRRIPLPWWQRAIALGLEAVLGLAVIGLKALAHG